MKKIFIKTALVVASTALSAIAGLQVAHADSYVVQQGDSFFGIASAHGMSPYDLAAKNGKSIFDTINPGDVLEVDGATSTYANSGYGVSNNAAVSYTHLDVYKRQVISNGKIDCKRR